MLSTVFVSNPASGIATRIRLVDNRTPAGVIKHSLYCLTVKEEEPVTQPVSYELNDGIATVTIHNGKANALGHEVFEGLNEALDRAEQDRAVVILAGQPGIFSGGYDLKEMQKGPKEAAALVTVGSRFTRSAGGLSAAGDCRLWRPCHCQGGVHSAVGGLSDRSRGAVQAGSE